MQGRSPKGALITSLSEAAHVVGRQHRVLGGLPQSVRAMRENEAQRAHEHAHLAVEGAHTAKRRGAFDMFDEAQPSPSRTTKGTGA